MRKYIFFLKDMEFDTKDIDDFRDFVKWVHYYRHELIIDQKICIDMKDKLEESNITYHSCEVENNFVKDHSQNGIPVLLTDSCCETNELFDAIFSFERVKKIDKDKLYYVNSFSAIREVLNSIDFYKK